MSTRVLIIPEDATYNGYVVKPLVERMFREIGVQSVQVNVCRDPAVKGKDTIHGLLPEILDRHPHTDLFLYFQDSDLRPTEGTFQHLERVAREESRNLLCVAAQPELEIYPLAGARQEAQDQLGLSWQDLRSHHRLKEDCFDVLAQRLGVFDSPGKGRRALMQRTLQNYRGLESVCSEIAALRKRITAHLEQFRGR